VAAVVLVVMCATNATAKGPSQAVISGPGLGQPIVVREPGSPTIGPDLASLIESSGILAQLWCRGCKDLMAKQPQGDLGPMYVVRYRVSFDVERTPTWVEQRTYPFAEPRAVSYVRPGQEFWGRRTVGGWYEAPKLRAVLLRIGVPGPTSAPPDGSGVDPAETTPFPLSIGGIVRASLIAAALIVGLVLLGRSARRAPQQGQVYR
jgi:hypothetical protein